MNIDRALLRSRLLKDLRGWDLQGMELWVQHVLHGLLAVDPILGATKHTHRRWGELPSDKSLFKTNAGCGLPIGNLTSQILANYFLNPLDRWIQEECGMNHYGRYVDDFFLIQESKEELMNLVPRVRGFLRSELGLTLHPRKVHLQPVRNGVLFLGAFHHHDHAKLSHRLKGNMWTCMNELNSRASQRGHVLTLDDSKWALPRLNSYLGLTGKLAAGRWEKKWLRSMHPGWWRFLRLSGNKIVIAKRHL
jgi:hypothetical protein